jgi:hypothetical protein
MVSVRDCSGNEVQQYPLAVRLDSLPTFPCVGMRLLSDPHEIVLLRNGVDVVLRLKKDMCVLVIGRWKVLSNVLEI